MDKYFKILFITNLTSLVIILILGVLFGVGTFSITEEAKMVFIYLKYLFN